jgi:hypothetical protein
MLIVQPEKFSGLSTASSMPMSNCRLVVETSRPMPVLGRGLTIAYSRERTEHGCGLCADVDSSRPWTGRGHGHGADIRRCCARCLPGKCSVIRRAMRGLLCHLRAGRQPGCARHATRTSTVIARTLPGSHANRCADIHRRCVRCFSPTARTLRGSCWAKPG